jgi:hypothetical protein
MFRKHFPVVLALAIVCLFLSGIGSFAYSQCVSHVEIENFGNYSNYYTACNAEMRTTFSWIRHFNGIPRVLCGVEGAGYEHWFGISGMPPGSSGQVVEWTHCSSLTNHRAFMTFEPIIDPEPHAGFADGTTFTVDYFAGNQE